MTATGYIAGTKSLAMVGHFIPLYKVQIAKVNLVLHEEVKRAVPYSCILHLCLRIFMFLSAENYGSSIQDRRIEQMEKKIATTNRRIEQMDMAMKTKEDRCIFLNTSKYVFFYSMLIYFYM